MRFHRHNVGVMIAIVAGLLAFGVALWPFGAPQPRTAVGDLWLAIVALCALAFLAAAFLVDRLPTLARLLLAGGGVLLALSGESSDCSSGRPRRASRR